MRQEWSPDELVAAWTSVDGDWPLVAHKTGATRLGFSVLLKFFEIEARFPQHAAEVPPPTVAYMAEQVKVAAAEFAGYSWSSRSIKYHRKQIRAAFGFREFTRGDEDKLAGWLAEEVCPVELAECWSPCATPCAAGEVYVAGAGRWRNPEEDLPGEFETSREVHYAAIRQPLDPSAFIANLRERMTAGLERLDAAIATGTAGGVTVTRRGGAVDPVPKLEKLPEPQNLAALKQEVIARCGTLDLLDRSRRRQTTHPHHRPLRPGRPAVSRRAGLPRTRPPRRRAAVPSVHRTRGTRLGRGRLELRVLRMGPHLHRPRLCDPRLCDPRLCAAIVDRITFEAHIVETGTESYRLRASQRKRATTARDRNRNTP